MMILDSFLLFWATLYTVMNPSAYHVCPIFVMACRSSGHKLAISAQGCFMDSTQTRDLPTQMLISNTTVENCISACADATYKYAGVQVGLQCCFSANSSDTCFILPICDLGSGRIIA